MKLVECVPNFSEGRDRKVLDAISEAIGSVEGVRLLDVDPGEATNRTVFTFVGPIDAVEEAAFLAIGRAAALIDMRAHRGAHPRMGATDVCPFVPLGATTMEDCVELSKRVGRRVGEQLGIPVYLYEEAASRPGRRSLADVRKGEYEGLESRMKDPEWEPDFGPSVFNARAGATAVGAREFLIAYNVNLNTRDRRLANRIAQNIRETGRPRRGDDGRIVKDAEGRTVIEPGPSRLDAVRATGWYIEEYGQAQVSINLTNFRVTPPHVVFDTVVAEAAAAGLRVTGSEVVGLIPLEAMKAAGRHYLSRQGKSPAAHEAELVRTAAVSLGLSDIGSFDPSRKIIEYRVAATRPLMRMSVSAFADEVSAGTPVPGGGSVSALLASLSASLSAMVSGISFERKGFESRRDELGSLGARAQEIKARMADAVDDDSAAFDRLLEANRMPRGSDAERTARDEAIQKATRAAIDVPLRVMKDALEALEIAGEVAARGAETALSDAGVAALAAAAAVEGAGYNVRINLAGLTDRAAAKRLAAEADALSARSAELARSVGQRVRAALDAAAQSSPAK